jgi:hypothetical protein
MAPVPSVDPSFTTTISKSWAVRPRTSRAAATARSTYASSLNIGKTTLMESGATGRG